MTRILPALLALALSGIASAQDANGYDTALNSPIPNAVAVLDALFDSRGKQARTNQQKLVIVERVFRHHGIDPSGMTNDQKASVFLDVLWRDLYAKVEADVRKQRLAEIAAALQANISSDLEVLEGQ